MIAYGIGYMDRVEMNGVWIKFQILGLALLVNLL
jgi:hypothetical protein